MANENEVGIRVKAREEAAAALGKTRAEIDKLAAQINKARKEMVSGSGDAQKLGEMIARQAALTKTMSEHVKTATTETSKLSQAAIGATDALADQAGAAGNLVRSLANLGGPATLAAAAIVGIGAAAVVATKRLADYQEQMDIISASTGLTSDEVAGLSVAAANVGQSFDQVRPALDFFTRKIGDAAEGNEEASAAFDRIGVSIKDFNGQVRPVGEILRDVGAALRDTQDPTDRASKAFDLFGRGAARSLAVITSDMEANTAAAKDMGIALDEAGKIAARHADTSFDRLKNALVGIANSFGVIAAQGSVGFVDAISKAAEAAARFMHDPNVRDMMTVLRRLGSGYAPGSEAQGFNLDAEELARNSKANFKKGKTGPPVWTGDGAGLSFSLANPFSSAADLLTMPAEKLKVSMKDAADAAKEAEKAAKVWKELSESLAAENRRFQGPERLREKEPGGVQYASGAFGPMYESSFQFAPQAPYFPMVSATGLQGGGQAFEIIDDATKKLDTWGEVGLNAVQNLQSGFGNMISDALHGVGNLGDAFKNMVIEVASQALSAIATKGFLSFLGVPLQRGGTVAMQDGGTVAASFVRPLEAQTGLVVQGIRGVDSVPAMLGRGETVISHGLTDALTRLVPKLERGSSGSSRSNVYNINLGVSVGSGGKMLPEDRIEVRQWLRDVAVPELRRVIQEGTR